MVGSYLKRLGILRTLLAGLLAALVVMAPFAWGQEDDSLWQILTSLIAPALVPIVFMLVLFDIVMARITMSAEDRKERYATVSWTYIVLLIAAAVAWGPFFSKLF